MLTISTCFPHNLLTIPAPSPQLELRCPALNSIQRIVASSVLADVVTSVQFRSGASYEQVGRRYSSTCLCQP
jgi:hypothetical protein